VRTGQLLLSKAIDGTAVPKLAAEFNAVDDLFPNDDPRRFKDEKRVKKSTDFSETADGPRVGEVVT
jgi:hypothetical protein